MQATTQSGYVALRQDAQLNAKKMAVLASSLNNELCPYRHGQGSGHPRVYFAGLLEPLPIGAPNFRERLDGLLAAMSADILSRVLEDKLEEDRCPFLLQNKSRVYRTKIMHPCYEHAH